MIPGPDQIVACPNCEALAKYMTLISGNNFGVRVWTDGKQVAPSLPRPPAVVKCHHCAECYWLADARKVGTVEPWGEEGRHVDPAWTTAPVVQEPGETEYYHALQKGLAADSQQERTLRVLAWWRRNDVFRGARQAQAVSIVTASAPSRKNLEALVRLLDEANEADRLMKAEVLRELGEFESANQVLSRVTSAKYTAVVLQLRLLCDAGDIGVRELQFGEPPLNRSRRRSSR
jgi:hypothetical protein